MIKQLQFTRFRGHEGMYAFGPGRNFIKGPNESGKSTIKEAIAFAWMGTDSAGTKNPDHLVTVNEAVTEVRLTTPKSTIARRKKRGATAEIKIIREGIPDVKITQTDLMNQLSISHEVFMSSWSVGYFMNLKPEARLKVLGEIARIDRRALLASILDLGQLPAQVKFVNPKIDADVVAGLRRSEQNKKQAQEAVLKTLQAQIREFAAEVSVLDEESVRSRIALLDEHLQEHMMYNQQLPRWKAENDKRSRVSEDVAKKQSEVESLQAKIVDNTKKVAALTDLGLEVKTKAEELQKKRDSLVSQRRELELGLPMKPAASAGECPTCGTLVSEDHVDQLMRPYLEAVDRYNKHAREVADHNKKIDEQVHDLLKQIDKALAKKNEVQNEIASLFAFRKTYDEGLSEAQRIVTQLKSYPTELLPPPKAPEGEHAELLQERDRLKNELHAYNLFKTRKANLDADIKKTEQSIHTYAAQVHTYAAYEEALLKLPELETEATLQKVAIPGVLMSLSDGELVVTDKDGVDYRCLSDGRRMKIDVALCLAIKKAEPRCPDWLFVDNADLMDEDVYVPDGIQVFIAQVDPTAKEVQVVSL
jgi:chromosome segregation ATPase